ncbi:PepSY domain-containing protein [Methylobrevis albus]|uniref:PepSY domain-containing protein n=1 Tax=Methylobrevis albus TaxID=2793297 RepID=A0A931MXT0_9HYPH|nr:PepSY domain-containing protein [Methylobrevis albus]MBH0236319.1 PepSY domain-containing protein [Methylobrevis albus]
MIKTVLFAGALALLPAAALAQEVPADVVTRIQAMLADQQCEVDADNIEADGDGYELDDVFCADGQYDIDLDANLAIVNKKAE